MRLFTAFLGLIYTVTCLAQIDTQTLETVLNNTFQEVVGYHEFLILNETDPEGNEVSVSKITIDNEYTDFDLGRMKASLITETIPLETNLFEQILLSADLSTDITDTEDERKSFDLSANVNVVGNTLTILKRVSTALGECTQKPINEESENSVHLGNILCHVQTGIDASNTVVELQGGFQEAANYAKLVYGNDADTDSIIGDLFSSLSIEPQGDDLVLKVSIDSEINLDEGEINRNELKALITLTVKEKGLELNVQGSAIFEERQLDEYVDLVKQVATDLQNRDSNTHITYYEDNLYLIFGLIEAFLIIEDEEEDDF